MRQLRLYRVTPSEDRRDKGDFCPVCHGNIRLCRVSTCPYMIKALTWIDVRKALSSENLFGASPPGVFVGEWGYPKVLAGPLVPPLADEDTSIMDSPENWLRKSFSEILRYRFTLVRGKSPIEVSQARTPDRLLSSVQELVMASNPTDMEVLLKSRPNLRIDFSSRAAPLGPSATIQKATLTENPSVPRPVEKVVADEDLKAINAALRLYDSGIPQRQITRLFSVGLLGTKRSRRLVPTEWSITAVDDILGNSLRKKILDFPEINGFRLFGYRALHNNVQILLLPARWMYEALEAWVVSESAQPASDYELVYGRKTYPTNIAGAYHASRFPVLEYLHSMRRQAGALVFLEVYRGWVPLGVWRFREIARTALGKQPRRFDNLEQALKVIAGRLVVPIERWIRASKVLEMFKRQERIEKFIT